MNVEFYHHVLDETDIANVVAVLQGWTIQRDRFGFHRDEVMHG